MNIQLSPSYSIPAVDYANQANAVLGIRGAGKSYTAMKAAEQLLEAGIPIVVFDPVGVWKNLKNGTGDHPGYQVVVAGGEGSDIRLTKDNAVDIVRAAMQEGISLVIDLYSEELANKSTWIKVVQETVDLLMYGNKSYSLRHIFLEEAAEFIPQRLGPQHYKVYGSLERLARMGRNARLGMTIINQRAEEVNKAILEICALSLLHKQVGKNSLTSIQKWLEVAQVSNSKAIIQSLPTLKQGECWAIGHEQGASMFKVSERNTFHPNPKSGDEHVPSQVADVFGFVARLNEALKKPEPAKEDKPIVHFAGQNEQILASEVTYLKGELAKANESIKRNQQEYSRVLRILQQVGSLVAGIEPFETIEQARQPIEIRIPSSELPAPSVKQAQSSRSGSITGGAMRMLKAAAMFPKGITKVRMATLARLSHGSGSFGTYLSTLKSKGYITGNNEAYWITPAGIKVAGDVEPLPTDPRELIESWCDIIGSASGAARMLRALGNKYPGSYTKDQLGARTELSHTSGSFGTYLSTLKRNGLIHVSGSLIKASDDLFINYNRS